MARIGSVKYSPKFLKKLSRMPARFLDEAQSKEILFKENPFAPQLRTHKLHGKEKDVWSFSATYHYRIKFVFLSDTSVLFLDIGTHDIYS